MTIIVKLVKNNDENCKKMMTIIVKRNASVEAVKNLPTINSLGGGKVLLKKLHKKVYGAIKNTPFPRNMHQNWSRAFASISCHRSRK